MDDLTVKLMQANAANAQLSAALWNALVSEETAHAAMMTAGEKEVEALRERVQGKERDL